MATTYLAQRPELARHMGSRSALSLHFPKASATAITKGDFILLVSGLAVVDNTDPTAGAVVGIAAETITAAEAKLQVAVYPALPGMIFKGTFEGVFAAADVGLKYEVSETSDVPVVQRSATTNVRVVLLGLADAPPGYPEPAIGDTDVPCFFSILLSKTIYNVTTSD